MLRSISAPNGLGARHRRAQPEPTHPRAFALAALFGAVAAVLGYMLSFLLHFPVGACQTVVAALLAGLATLVGRLR